MAIAATATGDDSHGAQRRLGIAEGIFERICTIVGDTFAAVSPEQTTFMALPNCFELFGFDFLIGAQARQIEVCLSLARSRSRWLGLTSNKRHSLRSSGAPRVWGGGGLVPPYPLCCAVCVRGRRGGWARLAARGQRRARFQANGHPSPGVLPRPDCYHLPSSGACIDVSTRIYRHCLDRSCRRWWRLWWKLHWR
eukprot:COSAG01_NODE_1168_length_11426_cov_339.595038_6_plen_195_part_00